MTAQANTVTAGDAQLVGTPGRPARFEDSERGEHNAEAVLSLTSGAGPKQFKEDCMAPQRRHGRPVRFEDPVRNAAYWARIDAIVDAAPPFSAEQRAVIRAQFHAPQAREVA
ncbi:hypothetical protein ABZU45_00545 [Streptomyces avermitilis]|uniref:hypothetical protein n=1 Tax=Streptomyces avermitilis TaxID=33903 RepID=UPI0033A23082